MKVLNAEERKKSFKEIESCFSEEQALSEANRCLQCSEPGCVKGCPAGVDCKGFILKIREKNFQGALQTILEEDSLPCFTCRGCNAEQQCEGACILAKKGEAISIRALERFAVEKSELKNINENSSEKTAAIIGSGPAGIAAAIELKKAGIKPKIFETQKNFGGLVLNAIPEYRIPKKTVEEQLKWMQKQGIEMQKNFAVGGKKNIVELLQEFDAVLIASGESNAKKIDLNGKNLKGVFYWNDFLEKNWHGNGEKEKNKKCVVVGGGDTAIDCARTALRMGFETTIAYRKNLEFMPCRKKEYNEALEEGIEFKYLLTPAEFLGNGKIERIKFQKAEIKKEEFVPTQETAELEADMAILAIGQEFDEGVFKSSILQGKPLKEETNRTELPGVFIAGDSVNRQKTIVHAIQSAKNASKEIQLFIKEQKQRSGKETGTHQQDILLGA